MTGRDPGEAGVKKRRVGSRGREGGREGEREGKPYPEMHVLPGAGVASEGNPRARVFAHIAEDHALGDGEGAREGEREGGREGGYQRCHKRRYRASPAHSSLPALPPGGPTCTVTPVPRVSGISLYCRYLMARGVIQEEKTARIAN